MPVLPDYLKGVAQNYTPGTPIHKGIEVINAPMQLWAGFTTKQKEELRGLLEWLGKDPDSYVEAIYKNAPPGGKNVSIIHKR